MALKHFNLKQDPKMAGLDIKFLTLLDNARTMADTPFKITSGVRTPAHSVEVGGTATDPHTKGIAADIACDNDEKQYLIVKGAIVAGIIGIGLGKGHVHLDIDPKRQRGIIFVEKPYDR